MPEYLDHIYQKECIAGMEEHLPDDCIDIIVTSPPYNIGIQYTSYSDSIPFKQYLDWIGRFGDECSRVLKDNGSFFLNIGDQPSDEMRSMQVAFRLAKNWHIQNTIHWVKSIAIPEKNINIGHYKPVNSQRYLNNTHEYIFHFTKKGTVKLDKQAVGVPYQDKSNIGRWKHAQKDNRDRGNMWFIPYDTVSSAKRHPAAFPPKLAEMCIKLHGIQEDTLVLDPFMGIGSTAKAAQKLSLNYVGFEVDKNYVKLARTDLQSNQKEFWS